jgi:gluconate 5-dehydrogenase
VTGGARGIGRAIASRLARAGASVAIGDRDAATAAATARELSDEDLDVVGMPLDVTSAAEVADVLDQIVRRSGRLDILVNNACRARYRFLLDMEQADWDDAVSACLTGTFLCAHAAAPLMRDQGSGKIINISSMAASVGLARTTAYAAAKGGVEAMTRVLAVELAPFKIQVNAVAPGPVDTEFSRSSLPQEIRRARLERMPAGRFGTADEVAALVGYLCSDEAEWITGAVFRIDGGYTAAGSIETWSPPRIVPDA